MSQINNSRVNLSKRMSKYLRHTAKDLDKAGFAPINRLARMFGTTEAEIKSVAIPTSDDSKNRFEVVEEKIRCRQGHSIKTVDDELLLEEIKDFKTIAKYGDVNNPVNSADGEKNDIATSNKLISVNKRLTSIDFPGRYIVRCGEMFDEPSWEDDEFELDFIWSDEVGLKKGDAWGIMVSGHDGYGYAGFHPEHKCYGRYDDLYNEHLLKIIKRVKPIAVDSASKTIATVNNGKWEVVHGTTLKRLGGSTKILEDEKNNDRIGLNRMTRKHIHMVSNPGIDRFKKHHYNVAVYVDIESAMKDGIKFYLSSNDVILSPGNKHGVIPSRYLRIVHI